MRSLRAALCLVVLATGGCGTSFHLGLMENRWWEFVDAGRDAQADAIAARMEAYAAEHYGPADPRTFAVPLRFAVIQAGRGRDDVARPLAEATVARMRTALGENSTRLAEGLRVLATVHLEAKRWREAEAATDDIIPLCLEPLVRATWEKPGCEFIHVGDPATVYEEAGVYDKAVTWLVRSEALPPLLGGLRFSAGSLLRHARLHANAGHYPEAIWYLERCMEIELPRYDTGVATSEVGATLGGGDVEVVAIEGANGFFSQAPICLEPLIEARIRTGALPEARRMEELQKRLWARGPDLAAELVERARFADRAWHSDHITSYKLNSLAFYYARKGRTLEAIATYEDALRRIDGYLAQYGRYGQRESFEWHIDELLGLAAEYEKVGRSADAERLYHRAVAVAETHYHPRHRMRLETVARLARAQSSAGHVEAADSTWRRYLALAETLRNREHADYAFGLAGLSDLRRLGGRSREADAARARADAIWKTEAARIGAVRSLPLPSVLQTLHPSAN